MVATLVGHTRCSPIRSYIDRIRRKLVVTANVGRPCHREQQYTFYNYNRGRRMVSSASSSSARYYDSHGDYQADAESGYFMTSSSIYSSSEGLATAPPPLFQHQDSLPRFPVPDLADTIERLKPTCLPLAATDRRAEERENFLRACDRFPEQASHLQRQLEDRASHQENWLQSWWNRIGYLQYREPSPINVNYLFQLPKTRGKHYSQLQRAARVLHSAFAYSELVQSGSLPQDVIGKKSTTPLCSSMYRYMFYSCRIPKPNQDVYRVYRSRDHCKNSSNNSDEETSDFQKHAVVSVKGHYFSVDLIDPSTGMPYAVGELELALEDCVSQAILLSRQTSDGGDEGATAAATAAVKNLGILTASNRDEWTSNRARLIEAIPGMKAALEKLESGLLLLCIDGDDNGRNAQVDSLSQNARSYLMGTQGRWYDKSIQFIVTPSGNLGLNGEHSMMDGMPSVGLCQYILVQEASPNKRETEPKQKDPTPLLSPKVAPIFANQTILKELTNASLDETKSMVQKATADFDKIRSSLDLEVQSFQGYGSTWIKTNAKCSPDAYVQMAIQLAIGKLTTSKAFNGNDGSRYVPWATYESTQVRSYRYGRTETTRSVSEESAKWVGSMLGNNSNAEELKGMFHEATQAHVSYIRNASQGGGVDRHLFGLQMLLAEQEKQNKQAVDLFEDPLFVESKTWKVSTSTLPVNPGFGPVVVPDGFGVAYHIESNRIFFTCTSYKGLAPALSHYLEESLVDMKEMVLKADNPNDRSKL